MDHASQSDDRGSITGFDVEGYAAWAGIDEEQVAAIIAALTDKAVIVEGRFAAWEKRQPKREDNSTTRVRAHRERVAQRDDAPEAVTPAMKRNVTQRNAPEKNRVETETEPEPEAEQSESRADAREVVAINPFAVYAAFLDETAQPDFKPAPAWKAKQIAIAARLLEQGFDADKVGRCVRFMKSQTWRTSPFDLAAVEKFIGTWEASGSPARDEPRGSPVGAGPRRRGQPDFSGIEEFDRLMDQHEGRAS